jgi:uncharacterized damage-inducible protein DinB
VAREFLGTLRGQPALSGAREGCIPAAQEAVMVIDPKQQFLQAFDREVETTMRVLRAFPEDQAELKPHPRSNSAKEVAWTFALECGLGQKVWNDELAKGVPSGSKPASPPETWSEVVAAVEKSMADYRAMIAAASNDDLDQKVHFFVAPKTMGEMTRLDFLWFLLHDQIHHRGQLSVYLRMADGKVPSIYGPTADEPWF